MELEFPPQMCGEFLQRMLGREPTIEHLLATPSGAQIDEIWSWEGVQHGDAGLINEGALTEMCRFHCLSTRFNSPLTERNDSRLVR